MDGYEWFMTVRLLASIDGYPEHLGRKLETES
jgi:hypothetical protein